MTREEAALILHPDTTMFALDEATTRDYKTRIELVEEACRMAAEVLRHRQSDAETGLAPCGCGGKAELCPVNDYYTARCERCRTTSDYYKTAEEAIDAWNKALG